MKTKSRFESAVGPASELNPEEWCIDCGHYKGVHSEDKCNYWTGLCKCNQFISRSEAIAAVKKSLNSGGCEVQGEKGDCK